MRRTDAADSHAEGAYLLQHGHVESSQPRPLAGCVAACVAVLAMAGYLMLGKEHVSNKAHDAGGFTVCRQVVGATLMCLGALGRHGKAKMCSIRSEHVSSIAKLGVLNWLNSVLFILGFKWTSSFTASVAQLAVPVVTYAYTSYAGIEPPSCRKSLGVCLIVAGCLLTVVASTSSHGHHGRGGGGGGGIWPWLGMCALGAQCCAFAAMLVVQKRVLDDYPVSLVVAWGYSGGAIFAIISSSIDGSLYHLPRHFNNLSSVCIILYSATVGAVAYFELITFATKHLPSTFVACSVALEPLAVSILSVLVFHRDILPLEVVGYAIALLGVGSMASLVATDDGEEVGTPRGGLAVIHRNKSCLSIPPDDDGLEMEEAAHIEHIGGNAHHRHALIVEQGGAVAGARVVSPRDAAD